MKEETLVELLERRFVTADGVIIWNEQVKGLIDGAINRASKNLVKADVIVSDCPNCKSENLRMSKKGFGFCRHCGITSRQTVL